MHSQLRISSRKRSQKYIGEWAAGQSRQVMSVRAASNSLFVRWTGIAGAMPCSNANTVMELVKKMKDARRTGSVFLRNMIEGMEFDICFKVAFPSVKFLSMTVWVHFTFA